MAIEQELNKKLAEWAGFTEVRMLGSALCGYSPTAKEKGYKYLDAEPVPNFTESLDACFKWLVLKLHYWEIRNYVPNVGTYPMPRAKVSKSGGDLKRYGGWVYGEAEAEAETPALALCQAIEKLIEEKLNGP